jgi:hypothetical protein
MRAQAPNMPPPHVLRAPCTYPARLRCQLLRLLPNLLPAGREPSTWRHVRAFSAAAEAAASDFGSRQGTYQRWSSKGPDWGDHSNFPIRQQMLECASARKLDALLQRHANELGPADVAAAWHVTVQQRLYTLARSNEFGERALIERLLSLTERHSRDMDPTSISTVVWALVTSEFETEPHLSTLLRHAERQIVSFRPAELCVCLWASCNATTLDSSTRATLFKALAGLIDRGMTMEHFAAYDLSVLVWAMGRAQVSPQTVVLAAEAEASKKAALFSPSDAARLMHGFAMLRHNPIPVVPPLTAAAAASIAEYGPDDIALLFVAFGKLCVEPDAKFMRSACKHLFQLLPPLGAKPSASKRGVDGNKATCLDGDSDDVSTVYTHHTLHPRHIAHVMWTLARLEYRSMFDVGFLKKSLRHLAAYPSFFTGDEIAAMLWGCSRLDMAMPQGGLEATARRLSALTPTENADTLVSAVRHVSVLAARARDVRSAERTAVLRFAIDAARAVAPHASQLPSADVASFVIGLGTLEATTLPKHVRIALEAASAKAAADMPTALLPRLTWAIVRLGWNNAVVMDALASASVSSCGLLSHEGLAQLAWSFAALDKPYPAVTEALARKCSPNLAGFTGRDKSRLAWAFVQLERFNRPGQLSIIKRIVQSVTINDVASMEPLSVAAFLWACTRVDEHPGAAFEAAAAFVAANTHRFSSNQLMQAAAALKKHSSNNIDAMQAIMRAVQDSPIK